jgi:hypothetical protein
MAAAHPGGCIRTASCLNGRTRAGASLAKGQTAISENYLGQPQVP